MERQDIDLRALPSDWEMLADAGRVLAEANDRNRWLLGDLARRVETVYGDKSLDKYASEINLYARTLRAYRHVSAFYPEFGTRGHFPNLAWSHFRECARLGDPDAALAMLEQCSANNWTTRELTDALNAALGRPPVKRPILETEVVASAAGIVVTDAVLLPGERYQIKVYEL